MSKAENIEVNRIIIADFLGATYSVRATHSEELVPNSIYDHRSITLNYTVVIYLKLL